MDQTACCTCATLLSRTPRVIASSPSSSFSEKERLLPDDRGLECCGRVICGGCIHKNPRFDTYCPYCQTSSTPSSSSNISSSGSPLPHVLLPSRFSLLASRTTRRRPGDLGNNEPPPYKKNLSDSSSPVSPSPPVTDVGAEGVDDKPPPYTKEAAADLEANDGPLPPSYDDDDDDHHHHDDDDDDDRESPSYVNVNVDVNEKKKSGKKSPDDNDDQDSDPDPEEPILHFLHHPHDTIASLALRYHTPPQVLRAFNRLLGSDHLLLGRQTILIPRPQHHHLSCPSSPSQSSDLDDDSQSQRKTTTATPTDESQVKKQKQKQNQNQKQKMTMTSLSPRPVLGEEEEARRAKIRRWMTACKCPDYDVALIYLSQADYDLDAATENYFADEAWERDHPVPSGSGSGSSSGSGSGSGGSNAQTTKIRDYHQRRLSRKIPASLLQPSFNW